MLPNYIAVYIKNRNHATFRLTEHIQYTLNILRFVVNFQEIVIFFTNTVSLYLICIYVKFCVDWHCKFTDMEDFMYEWIVSY
jgi:hypothetical protein